MLWTAGVAIGLIDGLLMPSTNTDAQPRYTQWLVDKLIAILSLSCKTGNLMSLTHSRQDALPLVHTVYPIAHRVPPEVHAEHFEIIRNTLEVHIVVLFSILIGAVVAEWSASPTFMQNVQVRFPRQAITSCQVRSFVLRMADNTDPTNDCSKWLLFTQPNVASTHFLERLYIKSTPSLYRETLVHYFCRYLITNHFFLFMLIETVQTH